MQMKTIYSNFKPVKLKRREVSTETGTLPNWTRTYYDFFLFELTTTKILRNIKIVVAHATWPAVGRIGCAGLPRPIWSKLDSDVSVVLTPIIYLHWSKYETNFSSIFFFDFDKIFPKIQKESFLL